MMECSNGCGRRALGYSRNGAAVPVCARPFCMIRSRARHLLSQVLDALGI